MERSSLSTPVVGHARTQTATQVRFIPGPTSLERAGRGLDEAKVAARAFDRSARGRIGVGFERLAWMPLLAEAAQTGALTRSARPLSHARCGFERGGWRFGYRSARAIPR